jgi:hypothetical protein
LHANTKLLGTIGNWTVPQLQQALSEYREARGMSPAFSAARNHALACATALCARGVCTVEQADALHGEYLNAIELDPGNAELLTNLAAFYAAASQGVIKTSISNSLIADQRQRLAKAQAAPATRH